jgi:hypothetical protein
MDKCPEVIDLKFEHGLKDSILTIKNKILGELKQRKIYNSNLIYRAFDSKRIEVALETGSDRTENSDNWRDSRTYNPKNILYAYEEIPNKQKGSLVDVILIGMKSVRTGLFSKIKRNDNEFGLSVYNANQLTPLFETYFDDPTYNRPDDVKPVAIFRVKLNQH